MNTINNSYSDERPSPDHMKKCLEAGMEQLAKEDICLALSGRVDSSLLLRTTADTAAHTGRNVYTVMFDSRLHPSCDLKIARRVARELGEIRKVIIVDELEQEVIKNNLANRRYLYKRHPFSKLAELAQVRGIRHILDGISKNGMHVYHPGIQVLKELGIISSLAGLRIIKAQARALASEYGISVASRPSTPCTTTRLPYGTALDYEVPGRIGAEETYVGTTVPGNVRLRLHGDIARLELDPEAFDVLMKCRREIVSRPKEIGSMHTTPDTEGLRSGSMDVGPTGLS